MWNSLIFSLYIELLHAAVTDTIYKWLRTIRSEDSKIDPVGHAVTVYRLV
jgi:hypothetical protein